MKFLVVLASLVALIEGLPQYSYPAPSHTPSISYGTPGSGLSISGGSGFTSGGAGFGVGGGNVAVGHGISGVGTGFTSGVGTGFTSGVGTGFTSGVGTGFTSAGGTGFTSGGGGTGFTSGGGGIVSGGAGGGVLVQKHIYVHVAPEEPEEVKQQAAFAARQATKHYKIIFIKAPSPPTYTAPIVQAQAQNQEKTLVYVLVKKPDEQQDIVVPTASSQAPSKPEVYFIRYKAKTQVSGGGAVGGGSIGGGAIGGGAIGGGAIGGGVISGGSIGGGLIGGTGVGGGDIGISTGISSSSIGIGRPSTQYGPPGHSAGPY